MKRPRLNALRTFEAAGRHLSFSVAGEELGVSQAAVSQQIRQLEGTLDARLFLRRNRGLSLTSVGEAYHLAVHEALDRLDAITDQLFPGAQDHVVTVQCTPSVATLWLIPRLGRLHATHPGIDLRTELGEAVAGLFVAHDQPGLRQHLQRGFVDIAGLVVVEEAEVLHREAIPDTRGC